MDIQEIMKFLLLFLLLCGGCSSQKKEKTSKPEITIEMDLMRRHTPDSLKYLWAILDSVFFTDQRYRKNNNSDTIQKYRHKIKEIDSINLTKVIPIINKYGILGYKEIGMIAHMAIVMTIQHADLATQEKYLPLFREAIKKKKIFPSNYAMLEDRIAVRNGKMQIYGTQVMLLSNKKAEFIPAINIDSINQRRASIGLIETIETYLKQFGIKWDIEKYKKELPRLKEKYKVN